MNHRILGLDILRSLAIIFVIISHSKVFFKPFYPSLNELSLFGYYGVEIFFVLSGFLIGGILINNLENNISIKIFLLKRWFRTMPNYYLFIILNILVYTYILHWPIGNYSYLLFGQNFAWEFNRYFFPESWSLAVEEWFYLFMAILIYSSMYIFNNIKKVFLILIILIIVFETFLRVYHVEISNPSWDSGVRKIVIFRFDSLLYGVLGAYIYHFYKNYWLQYKHISSFVGIVLFSINVYLFIFYYPESINNSYYMRTYYFSLTSLSIMLLLPFFIDIKWEYKYQKLSKMFTFISLISYSLYLTHFLLKDIIFRFITMATLYKASYIWILWIFTSLILSFIIYKFYERPLTNYRNKFI